MAGGGDSLTAADHYINAKYVVGPLGDDFLNAFKQRYKKEQLIEEKWLNRVKCPVLGHLMGWTCDPEKAAKESCRANEISSGLALQETIRLNRLRYDWDRRRPRPPKWQSLKPPPPSLPDCRDYPECPMYPVHPEVYRWLNMGTRNEGLGSAKYLHLRKYDFPEGKFPLPITTNTEYGWKLKDACSKWGNDYYRTCAMNRQFWRRRYSLPAPQLPALPECTTRRPPIHITWI